MQVRRLLRQARTPSLLFVMAYLGCMLYRHVRDLRSRDTYYYSYMHRLVPITRSPFSHPPVPITSSCLIYKSVHGAAGNARNKYVLSP